MFAQFGMHARATIGSAAVRMNGLDVPHERAICLAAPAFRSGAPGVVTTPRNLEYAAERDYRILARMVLNELILAAHWGIREKMPSAFFKMSRS